MPASPSPRRDGPALEGTEALLETAYDHTCLVPLAAMDAVMVAASESVRYQSLQVNLARFRPFHA